MTDNCKKESLRIFKTKKALMNSLSKLLEFKNFTQITVNELCDEALVSRTAFYLHFNDKYDLLKYWLSSIKPAIIYKHAAYVDIEESINGYVNSNMKKIKNLTEGANSETSGLLCDFLLSLLGVDINRTDEEQADPRYIILSEFCRGGLMRYLMWQIKNKFPEEFQTMNPYIYDVLNMLKKWNADKDNRQVCEQPKKTAGL